MTREHRQLVVRATRAERRRSHEVGVGRLVGTGRRDVRPPRRVQLVLDRRRAVLAGALSFQYGHHQLSRLVVHGTGGLVTCIDSTPRHVLALYRVIKIDYHRLLRQTQHMTQNWQVAHTEIQS